MATRSRPSGYRLNVKFLARLVGVVVLVAVTVFFVHRYQESRLKDRYLTQADQARDQGSFERELHYLRQYIGLDPYNTVARVRYGTVLARYSSNPTHIYEAYLALQRALQNDPSLPADVRLHCARLALRPDINLPNDARRDLDILIKNEPDNPEYAELYADCLVRTGDYVLAEKFLTEMIGKYKTHIDAFARLAWLKKEKVKTSNPNAAETVLQQMLQNPINAANPKAWLRVAGFHRAFGPEATLIKALAEAQSRAPNDPDVLAAAGEQKLMQWRRGLPPGEASKATADYDEGTQLLERSLKNLGPLPAADPMPEPNSPDRKKLELAACLYQMLSQNSLMAGRLEDAEKHARELVRHFPEQLSLQKDLVSVLVRRQQFVEAEKICVKLANANISPAFVEVQRGFIAAQQKRWIDASRHLERTITEATNIPDLSRRAHLLSLAVCYEHTGEIDRVYETLRKALPASSADPSWIPTKFSLAETMARLGRNPEAIREYQEVVEKEPRALQPLIQLLLLERSRQSSPGGVDADLDRFLAQLKPSPQTDVLRAQALAARKDTAGAQAALKKSLDKNPDSIVVYRALFDETLRQKDLDEAGRVLAQAESKLGATYAVHAMKIAMLTMKPGTEAARAAEMEALAAGLDKYTPAERAQLLQRLSYAARGLGRRDLARAWLDRIAAEKGDNDIDLHYQRFDLAILDGDETRMNQVLEEIARVAGGKDNSSYKLAYAFSLIARADRIKDRVEDRLPLLERASETLAGLEATRKDWGRLDLAQAKVADMLGRREVAIQKFRQAVDHGERQPEVFIRLADLYLLAKNNEGLQHLISTYPQASTILADRSQQLVAVLISTGDFAKAVEIARRAVPSNSTDVTKMFWLSGVLNSCGQHREAEELLKKTLVLDPRNADIWLFHLQMMVKNQKKAEAKKVLEQTKAQLKPEDSQLAVAQGYQLVDEKEQSRQILKELQEKRPDDLNVLRAAGGLAYSVRDYPEAGRIMEKILQHPRRSTADDGVARRTLALCTVATQNHQNGVRAMGLLGYASTDAAAIFDGKESIEDLRCRYAVLSVIRGRAARIATAAVLAELERKPKGLTTELQLAFGKLQFALGDWVDAKRRMLLAVNAPDAGTMATATYANMLLRKGELDEARHHVDRLAALEPTSPQTAAYVARLAVLEGQPQKAVEVLSRYANRKDSAPEMAAAVLEQLGLPEDAGPFYRRAAENSRRPEQRLLLAYHLARQAKAAESMAEFEKAWDASDKAAAVPLLCQAMMHISQASSPAIIQKATDLLEAETKARPEFKPLLAAFYSMVDRVPEAVSLSREIIAADATNVFTINNLAFMLSLKDGKHEEAFKLLRAAIALVGPLPNLLDTEATVLIAAGRPVDAIEKLKEVVVDEPSASSYMRLAQANLLANRRTEALMALAEAKKYNLRITDFHPLERNSVRNALTQLGG